ncbi:MAG: D-alanyl-D-alanine carboxypeptidase family protein [Patescibacteria group bacterium]
MPDQYSSSDNTANSREFRRILAEVNTNVSQTMSAEISGLISNGAPVTQTLEKYIRKAITAAYKPENIDGDPAQIFNYLFNEYNKSYGKSLIEQYAKFVPSAAKIDKVDKNSKLNTSKTTPSTDPNDDDYSSQNEDSQTKSTSDPATDTDNSNNSIDQKSYQSPIPPLASTIKKPSQLKPSQQQREQQDWNDYRKKQGVNSDQEFADKYTPKTEESERKLPGSNEKIRDKDKDYNFRSLKNDRFSEEQKKDTYHSDPKRLKEADNLKFQSRINRGKGKVKAADQGLKQADKREANFIKYNQSASDRVRGVFNATSKARDKRLISAQEARDAGKDTKANLLESKALKSNKLAKAALKALPKPVKRLKNKLTLEVLKKTLVPILTNVVIVLFFIAMFMGMIISILEIYCRPIESVRNVIEAGIIGATLPASLASSATSGIQKGLRSPLRVQLEDMGICKAYNPNFCAQVTTEAAGSTVSRGSYSGGDFCFDKALEGKTEIQMWTANNGLKKNSNGLVPVSKIREVIAAGLEAGVPDYITAWVITLAPTESNFRWNIDNGVGCYGIIQFCRSAKGGGTYQSISKQVTGKDVPPSEFVKNRALQMKFAEAQYKTKLIQNCSFARNKYPDRAGDFYLAAYSNLGCVGRGSGDGNTKSTDYGEAAVRNAELFECDKSASTSTNQNPNQELASNSNLPKQTTSTVALSKQQTILLLDNLQREGNLEFLSDTRYSAQIKAQNTGYIGEFILNAFKGINTYADTGGPGNFVYNGEDEETIKLISEGKIKDVIRIVESSRPDFPTQIRRKLMAPTTLKALNATATSGKFDYIQVSSGFRQGAANHGTGYALDVDAVGYKGQHLTHTQAYNGNRAAIQAFSEFARALKDTGVLQRIISAGPLYNAIKGDNYLDGVNFLNDPKIHYHHYHIDFNRGDVQAVGASTVSVNSNCCYDGGSNTGSTGNFQSGIYNCAEQKFNGIKVPAISSDESFSRAVFYYLMFVKRVESNGDSNNPTFNCSGENCIGLYQLPKSEIPQNCQWAIEAGFVKTDKTSCINQFNAGDGTMQENVQLGRLAKRPNNKDRNQRYADALIKANINPDLPTLGQLQQVESMIKKANGGWSEEVARAIEAIDIQSQAYGACFTSGNWFTGGRPSGAPVITQNRNGIATGSVTKYEEYYNTLTNCSRQRNGRPFLKDIMQQKLYDKVKAGCSTSSGATQESSNETASLLNQALEFVSSNIRVEAATRPRRYSDLSTKHKEFLKEVAKEYGDPQFKDAGGVNPEASAALLKMQIAYGKKFPIMQVVSKYRSIDSQVGIYFSTAQGKSNIISSSNLFDDSMEPGSAAYNRALTAYKARAQQSAPPGHSEHHTGLVFDIGSVNKSDWTGRKEFRDLYKWLQENAKTYGFTQSFPESRGERFEQWHWRYDGTDGSMPINEFITDLNDSPFYKGGSGATSASSANTCCVESNSSETSENDQESSDEPKSEDQGTTSANTLNISEVAAKAKSVFTPLPAHAQEKTKSNTLDLKAIATNQNNQAHSIIIQEVDSGSAQSYNANTPPASIVSTIKLPIAIVIEQEMKRRGLSGSTEIEIPAAIEGDFENLAGKITIQEALNKMLTDSSNTATNGLVYYFGGGNDPNSNAPKQKFTELLKSYGFNNTAFNKYLNINNGKGTSAEQAISPRLPKNTGTATDISKAMRTIFQSENTYPISSRALKSANDQFSIGALARNNGLEDISRKWGGTSQVTATLGTYSINKKKYVIGVYVNADQNGQGATRLRNTFEEIFKALKAGQTIDPNQSTENSGTSSSVIDCEPANSSGSSFNSSSSMLRLLAHAKQKSEGIRPDGMCLCHVNNFINTVGFAKIPTPVTRLPEARNYHEWLVKNGPKYGITNLIDTNPNMSPYEAPAGSIVFVTAGSPGTTHDTAGDIAVADGNGKFYNGGEMGYDGPQAWKGSTGTDPDDGSTGKLTGVFVTEEKAGPPPNSVVTKCK